MVISGCFGPLVETISHLKPTLEHEDISALDCLLTVKCSRPMSSLVGLKRTEQSTFR